MFLFFLFNIWGPYTQISNKMWRPFQMLTNLMLLQKNACGSIFFCLLSLKYPRFWAGSEQKRHSTASGKSFSLKNGFYFPALLIPFIILRPQTPDAEKNSLEIRCNHSLSAGVTLTSGAFLVSSSYAFKWWCMQWLLSCPLMEIRLQLIRLHTEALGFILGKSWVFYFLFSMGLF